MLCVNQADKADIDPSTRTTYIGRCSSSCKSNKLQYEYLKEKHSTPSASTSPGAEFYELPGTLGGSRSDHNYDPKTDSDNQEFPRQSNASEDNGSSSSNIPDDQPTAQAPGNEEKGQTQSPPGTSAKQNSPECRTTCGAEDCDDVCVSKSFSASSDPTPTSNQADLCNQAHKAAMNDCNTESQSWMKNIQLAAQGLGPVMESGACGKLAAANVGASTSLSTFKIMCNNATQACLTECRKPSPADLVDSSAQTTMASNLRDCNAKGVKAREAEQAAAQGTQQLLAAVQQCKAAFGVNSNPFKPGNDPYKGQTPEEIMANLQPSQGGSPLEYSGAQGSGASNGNSSIDLSGLESEEEATKPRGAPKSAASAPGGSMGSAGLGGGGGSGVDAGGGGGSGKRPSGGLLSNILSGFFGGSGGGGLFGGTGRSKGGGLSGFFGEEKPQAETKTPDLRQFMPGGAMDPRKARGLAGQRMGKDGMSGPHGNIWQMINNRYQYKKASLLP